MEILPKKSRVVLEEEDNNNGTMAEREEGDEECVWMDGEDEPTYELMYDGKGKKNHCMNREHAEDSVEANNCSISKLRSESRNKTVQSKTQAKPIDLSRTAHPQLRSLSLRHKSDVHSGPSANRRKKRESSMLAAHVQPTPKRDSVLQHWWKTG